MFLLNAIGKTGLFHSILFSVGGVVIKFNNKKIKDHNVISLIVDRVDLEKLRVTQNWL